MKFDILFKYDKKNWYFTSVYDHISLISSYNEKCFRQTFVEKIKAYNLCSRTFSRKSCRLWDNVGKTRGRAGQATDDNITRRIRVACRIAEATDIHSEYVIFIAFPRQRWLREHASVWHYSTYIACLVCFQPPVDTRPNKRNTVFI